MGMAVVVTRNVPMRFRGFLASCMLEVAPGIYTNPRLTKAVRERIWAVLTDWFAHACDASVVLVYADGSEPGGQGTRVLGEPPCHVFDADGVLLSVRRAEMRAGEGTSPSCAAEGEAGSEG